MHDWQEAVRRKLASAAISRWRREDLIAELANHLEDTYGEFLACGVAEPEALAECLEVLDDVPQIAAAVKQSQIWEDAMNQRSRTLWLPGLVTLTLASVSLMAMQLFTFSRPRAHWLDGGQSRSASFGSFHYYPAARSELTCAAGPAVRDGSRLSQAYSRH